jgi:hypothetical protein
VPLEAFTRVICFVVGSIVIYLVESGTSLNQLRAMILLWLNSLYHACSVQVNPVLTFLLLAIVTDKSFDYIKVILATNTQERKVESKPRDEGLDLPISKPGI